jgi:hypothetical protein
MQRTKLVPAITTNFFKKYRPLPSFRRKWGLLNLQDGSKFYNFLYMNKACSDNYNGLFQENAESPELPQKKKPSLPRKG